MNLSGLLTINTTTDIANKHQDDGFAEIVCLHRGEFDIELRAELCSQQRAKELQWAVRLNIREQYIEIDNRASKPSIRASPSGLLLILNARHLKVSGIGCDHDAILIGDQNAVGGVFETVTPEREI